ncbi:hypothetical protein B6U90_07395 [Thermoplasmatales archaeon ex4484_6]|nr:MAG: hypothetical protein B6U90_07395 [Thermoplasmatales archaeon ex4484_6]
MEDRVNEGIGVIVLAGNTRIKRQIRRRKRRGFFFRVARPHLWTVDRKVLEAKLTSKINRDDYIVGENKSLLYLHPDLISSKNLNFLKRVLYFAGKTGDRFYRRKKGELLRYLSERGETPISLVMRAVGECRLLDSKNTIIIGPKKQIESELERSGIPSYRVVEQGDSIGENILIGKEELSDMGYGGERILVTGGDIPIISADDLKHFIEDSAMREGEADILFGMGSRQQLGSFIEEQGLTSMGAVGPNYPRANNLNKFGIPLIDDAAVFGEKDARVHFMVGNIFLISFNKISSRFMDRFYSLRKMGANPLAYPYLIRNFGRALWRATRWKVRLTEAENIFEKVTGVKVKVVPVPPPFTLDLDSYTDLRRLSALYFRIHGTTHDLELDFKDFLKQHRRERRRRKGRKRSGGVR